MKALLIFQNFGAGEIIIIALVILLLDESRITLIAVQYPTLSKINSILMTVAGKFILKPFQQGGR